ncbi:MAG: carboxy terminal-processing peptidase [Verrucomicrobiota bacterium]
MNLSLRPVLSLLTVTLMGCILPPAARAEEKTDYGLVAGTVANMLMESHYSMRDFEDELSGKALQNFFDYLDYSRLYFTKPEIENFRSLYETKIDDYVFKYNIKPAKEIHGLYVQKVKDRAAKVRALLEGGKLDFNTTETSEISRKDAPWAATEAELDDLWKRQITREVLQEHLNIARAAERKKAKAAKDAAAPATEAPQDQQKANEKTIPPGAQNTPPTPPGEVPKTIPPESPAIKIETVNPDGTKGTPKTLEKTPDTPEQKILKRYDSFLKAIAEQDDEDATNFLLSCISNAYDPHSDYLSSPEQDRFNIDMKKSLTGIGAVLKAKDGAAEISSLVSGGPADKSGGLHVGDLITGVGEGLEGEVKPLDGLKLEKIVQLIRGEENTTVRLKIQPADDPTTFRELKIIRAKVEIKDTLAKAELIELNKAGAPPVRIGWIELESFYADMENMNKKGAVSATAHIKSLLLRLQKEGISGLVLDLRGNGGGSLEEAIRLTGLFMKSGPVVQQRDNRNRVEARYSRGSEPVYTGPLVVVTDRASASASEICAAALQDYGRAVIVGDKTTFGKGTVQTILGVADHMPLFSARDRAGSLKVTIQKFYRIAGGSTQREGVKADVVLPSRYDESDLMGETSLKDPLPYDTIEPMTYDMAPNHPLPFAALRERSSSRVKSNPEFGYIVDVVTRTKELLKKNSVSLNEATRLAEDKVNEDRFNAQKEERKARIAEANKGGDPYKVFPLTIDTVGEASLKTDTETKADEKAQAKLTAPVDDEDAGETVEEAFPHGIEPVKAETLEIVRDLIELAAPVKGTAKSN